MTQNHFLLPPDVFWISPDGAVIEIIGHLTELQSSPERFGLHAAPRTKAEIDDAFQSLWAAGWVRGRFSDGTFFFQMERPRRASLKGARTLVAKFVAHATTVQLDFTGRWRPRDLSAKDFLSGEPTFS